MRLDTVPLLAGHDAAAREGGGSGPVPAPAPGKVLADVLDAVADSGGTGGTGCRLVGTWRRPARAGEDAPWPDWVPAEVVAGFAGAGVTRPWRHQAAALDLVHRRRHLVVATRAASGKSLIYQVPACTGALRGGVTVYLSPTTALAADQADRLRSAAPPGVTVASLDASAGTEERRWARERADVLLFTPDFAHHAVLPQHDRWHRVLRRLDLLVLDECHVYRGVFGAHVSAVVRRLLRAARVRGADPVVVACSATATDPVPFVTRLSGVTPVPVLADTAPDPGAATVVAAVPGGRSRAAADLLARCVDRGLQTAAFTGSRASAEQLARRARRTGTGTRAISSYRAGHLADERRSVERRLRDGTLRGVATTSALEAGVDITGLDVVLLDGWPGSATALAQRSGRAGRAGRAGVTLLLAGDDPVDTHLVQHPEQVLGLPPEAAVTDPDNPLVLTHHLVAAALESPLTDADAVAFGPNSRPIIDALVARGDLRRRPAGWFWSRRERPAVVDLRAGSGCVTLLEDGTGRVLGTVDAARAPRTVHPGAVYLHGSQTYVVSQLDLDADVALLSEGDPGYTTAPLTSAVVEHGPPARTRGSGPHAPALGPVTVRSRVTGYLCHDASGRVLSRHTLDMPESATATMAVWWRPPAPVAEDGTDREAAARHGAALHAVEHAMMSMLPLVVPCDPHDVAAGVSGHTVTVWDAWPGGTGYAEAAYRAWQAWTDAGATRLRECTCRRGCPSCVLRPGCERGNRGLDKGGALTLLESALAAA